MMKSESSLEEIQSFDKMKDRLDSLFFSIYLENQTITSYGE